MGNKYTCHFDGSYRNHEGEEDIGIGCSILDENEQIVFELSLHIDGPGSTNYAEYCACIEVLKWLTVNDHDYAIINGDSKIVINQLNGLWRIREGVYKKKAIEAKKLFKTLPNVDIKWSRRNKNKEADSLASMGLNGDNYIIQN